MNIYRCYFKSIESTNNPEKCSIEDISRVKFLIIKLKILMTWYSDMFLSSKEIKPYYLQVINQYVRYDLVAGFALGLFFILKIFFSVNISSGFFSYIFVSLWLLGLIAVYTDLLFIKYYVTYNQVKCEKRFNEIFLQVLDNSNILYFETSKRVESPIIGSRAAIELAQKMPGWFLYTGGVGVLVYGAAVVLEKVDYLMYNNRMRSHDLTIKSLEVDTKIEQLKQEKLRTSLLKRSLNQELNGTNSESHLNEVNTSKKHLLGWFPKLFK